MELKINCNKAVSLNKMIDLKEVNVKILSYSILDKTLDGDTLIYGKYIMEDKKNKQNKEVEFEEIVPFTVVFSRENINVIDCNIANFLHNKNDDNMNVQFDIIINYNIDNIKDDSIMEVPVIPSYELNIEEESNIIETSNENNDKSDEITKQINDKMDTFFLSREPEENKDENKEEELKMKNEYNNEDNSTNNIFINKNDSKTNPLIHSIKTEKFSTTTIYFTNSSADIEKISKEENVGIDKLYKDNENYLKNKKIIVHK